MRGICVLTLLIALPAIAAPTVPRDQITMVPEAWRGQWAPYDEAVQTAKEALADAERTATAANAELDRADAALGRAKDMEKQAAKAHKAARKAKDPARSKAAAANKATALSDLSDAGRRHAKATSDRDLAQANVDLCEAKVSWAQARREQVVAQAVSDAGGWAEMVRFDGALAEAAEAVKTAEARLETAKAQAVLTAQGR
ncbi:MAG: hypothetical protein AB8H79_03005 [Myxococcota bacterium]